MSGPSLYHPKMMTSYKSQKKLAKHFKQEKQTADVAAGTRTWKRQKHEQRSTYFPYHSIYHTVLYLPAYFSNCPIKG